MGLQLLCPLPELHLDPLTQFDDSAALEQLGREGRGIGYSSLQQGDGDTDAEDAEAVQQGHTHVGGNRQRTVLAGESVDGQHCELQIVGGCLGKCTQCGELTLAQCPGGHREQPGDGDDGLAQSRCRQFAGISGGDLLGREHRVDPSHADLVRT